LSAIGRASENADTTNDTMSAEDADNRLRGLALISRSSEGSLGPDMEAGLKINFDGQVEMEGWTRSKRKIWILNVVGRL
jgi:hypothetical protein